jgi:hypothetical protein
VDDPSDEQELRRAPQYRQRFFSLVAGNRALHQVCLRDVLKRPSSIPFTSLAAASAA